MVNFLHATFIYTNSSGNNEPAAGAKLSWNESQGGCWSSPWCDCPSGPNGGWSSQSSGNNTADSTGTVSIPIQYCCGPVTISGTVSFNSNNYEFLWQNIQSGCGIITGDIEATFLLCGGQAQALGQNSLQTCRQCTSNSNCPSGYICVNGVCQQQQNTPGAGPPPPPFDYTPLIAVAIIVGIVIVIALVVMKKI